MIVLKTSCYLVLEPRYDRRGNLVGVRVAKVTQRPTGARSVRLTVAVPESAFTPFRAHLDVPETSLECSVEVEDPEAPGGAS